MIQLSALFIHESNEDPTAVRAGLDRYVVGPTPKVTAVAELDQEDCSRDEECPPGCVEQRFAYFFEVDAGSYEAAQVVLRSQLLEPDEVICFAYEGELAAH